MSIIPPNILSGPDFDNGHNPEQASLLNCDPSHRFHLYPKGAALVEIMGRDAIRRFFDFI